MNEFKKRIICIMLVLMIVLSCCQVVVFAAEVTTSPLASNIVVYNNVERNTDYSVGPVVYINQVTTPETVARVYSASSGGKLLGEAVQNSLLNIAYVSVDEINARGGTLYVTLQEPNKSESARVAVAYGKTVTPRIDFIAREITEPSKPIGGATNQPPYGSKVYPYQVEKDKYYQVEVNLTNFGKISGMTLPVRYDTNVLELVSLTETVDRYTGESEYYVSDSPVSEVVPETVNGMNFDYRDTSFYKYSILPGTDIATWGGAFANMASLSADPDTGEITYRGEYQYVNTQTGLIRVNAGAENANTLGTDGMALRLYMKAKINGEEAVDPMKILWIGTEDDYDTNGDGSFTDRRKYYDLANPGGATVTLWGANLLCSPLSSRNGTELDLENPLALTSTEIEQLPQSVSDAIGAALLPPNKLKIYNYTNYTASGLSGGTLDEYKEDVLVLTPSTKSGAPKAGDIIRVYEGITDTTPMYTGTVVDGETMIPIGTGFLKPEGGTIYVTNSRNGQESDKLAFEYIREMKRKVHFKVVSHTIDPSKSGTTDMSLLSVKKGDRIRIEVYFDDINELMSYTFPIHFNPLVVKATDAEYNVLPTGTLTEENYKDDSLGYLAGTDLEPLSVNELLIHYAYLDGDETEIAELMASMGIDRDTFNAMAEEIATKMQLSSAWSGGILYTGERDFDKTSTYPYVDNEKGLYKISAVSFVPSGILEGEAGHHFLTLNFVATGNGIPDFRFATFSDTAYDASIPDGGVIYIVGPDTEMSKVAMNESWEAYYEEGYAGLIDFEDGNALPEDIASFGADYNIDKTTQFVYYKYQYRDPGFTVYKTDGAVADATEVSANLKRYYIDDSGARIELPVYNTDEVIPTDVGNAAEATTADIYFGLDNRTHYSKVYDLIYEYTDPHVDDGVEKPPNAITATRKVVMLYKRGDVNRDSMINEADSGIIARYAAGLELSFGAAITDRLYRTKTVNTDMDANNHINEADSGIIMRYASGLQNIEQDYSYLNELMK